MRVPTRSAGTRSGVNWMRRKLPRTVEASVLTVRVFASPGTPSTSRCPPASIAKSTRSMSGEAGSMAFPLERRETDRRGGVLDRHGEADADENAILRGVEEPG